MLWKNIQAHLWCNHFRHFDQLFGIDIYKDGFYEVKVRKSSLINDWIRETLRQLTSDRPILQLQTVPF
jgi:hypothetical protein